MTMIEIMNIIKNNENKKSECIGNNAVKNISDIISKILAKAVNNAPILTKSLMRMVRASI